MLPSWNRAEAGAKRVLIVGCGRIGARVAATLAEQGHSVHVVDPDRDAFDLLPPGMVGSGQILPIVGDGTLEADLRKASAEDSDVLVAVAGRDTRNALAAQIAKHILQVPTVICRMNDPVRKEMYGGLGLITISASKLVTDMVLEAAGS